MADFIGTLESDDEVPQLDTPASTIPRAAVPKQKRKKAPSKKELKANKRKRELLEEQDEDVQDGKDDEFKGDFAFDGLGGGYNSGHKDTKGDIWDLTDTIDLFKKKNGIPQIDVDDIIAKRNNKKLKASIPEATIEEIPSEPEEEDEEESELPSDLEANEEDLSDDDKLEEASDIPSDASDQEDDFDEAAFETTNALVSTQHDSDSEGEEPKTDANYFSAPPSMVQHSDLPPFSQLPDAKLSRPILLGLSQLGLTTPTPVQASTIPVVLLGKDVVGSSVTGSGKTVAFWVGVLERLLHRDKRTPATRVVAVCPTRELAVQVCNVGKALARYTDITFALCVGGLSLKVQEMELKKRPDIVVCTPGRLIDHVRNTNSFSLDSLEVLIIDEADRILEEGFRDELTEIISACPRSRSTLLFSATITEDVSALARLSLSKPVRIKVDQVGASSSTLTQEFLRIKSTASKADSLAREATLLAICRRTFRGKTIIFFRNKVTAHKMKILFGLCGLRADELHGNLSQEQRLESLQHFRTGQVDYLLATDLASRGLDIKGIDYVINAEMPASVEIYLHRVGRTARAGAKGRALTLVGEPDRKMVKLAIKHAKNDTVKQRVLEPELIKSCLEEIKAMQSEIKSVLEEEHEEKEIRRTEMELKKGQNLIEHADEIKGRPARTWFASQSEKNRAKNLGAKGTRTPATDGSEPLSRAQRIGGKEKNLNHKQRRRQEALEDAKKDSNPAGAIKAAKKAARPVKLNSLEAGPIKPVKGKGAKGKKDNKKTKSTFSKGALQKTSKQVKKR